MLVNKPAHRGNLLLTKISIVPCDFVMAGCMCHRATKVEKTMVTTNAVNDVIRAGFVDSLCIRT